MEVSYSDKKVLIVDNRLEDLGELKLILGSMGVAEIHVASSVNMAMILLREQRYDLCFVVFDLGKDQKNGLQLIQEASAEGIRQFSTIFVLIVDPDRSRLLFGSLESSPDTYISKPYGEAKIRNRIEKIMRVKATLKPLEQLIDGGEMQSALQVCNKMVQQFPGLSVFIQRLRGVVLLDLGLFSEAEHVFETIVQQRDQPWARVGLGMSLCHLGNYKGAQLALQHVIDESHFCVEAYTWLARTYRAVGERGEAIALLRKSVMLQPTVPELQGVLGSLAAQNGEWSLSADAFEQAIRYGRNSCFQSEDFYFGLVGALMQQGKADVEIEERMIRILEDVVLAFPEEPIIQFKSRLMAAQVYRFSGSSARADLAAQNAFDLFRGLELSDQAEWLDPFVEGMEGTSVQQHALDYRQQVNRDSAALEWGKLNLQGMLSYRKKDFRKALGFFVRAEGLMPNNPSIILNLVQAAMEQARKPGPERQELLLQCDNALYGLNFGALSGKQQRRFLSLAERCAQMVKELLETQQPRSEQA